MIERLLTSFVGVNLLMNAGFFFINVLQRDLPRTVFNLLLFWMNLFLFLWLLEDDATNES